MYYCRVVDVTWLNTLTHPEVQLDGRHDNQGSFSFISPATEYRNKNQNQTRPEDHKMSTATTQRLLRELKDYSKSPNEALLHLGPVDEENLLNWEAVLKGVNGTPYEGILYPVLFSQDTS